MDKQDIIGLGMAYLGCIWIMIAYIIFFAYGSNMMFQLIESSCLFLTALIIYRKRNYFTEGFDKMIV